jgi:hypothetical protein
LKAFQMYLKPNATVLDKISDIILPVIFCFDLYESTHIV